MNATLSPAILARFPQQRVLIVGDVMLDEYIWGAVRRISQEAPVPIVEAQRRTYVPGGASNVATNAVSLGGVALLCGLVGTDESAGQLRRALVENGVLAEGLRADATRPTTTKTRILAQSQQVARIDTEQRDPISEALETELLAWTAAQMPTVGVCVLSDYSKGVISSRIAQGVIAQARANNKPVVVDPKGTDFTKYRGATVITPNIPEAEKATNSEIRDEADLWRVSRLLLEILDGSDLLITRGAQGMSLFSAMTSLSIFPPSPAMSTTRPAQAIPLSARWRWPWPQALRSNLAHIWRPAPPESWSANSAPPALPSKSSSKTSPPSRRGYKSPVCTATARNGSKRFEPFLATLDEKRCTLGIARPRGRLAVGHRDGYFQCLAACQNRTVRALPDAKRKAPPPGEAGLETIRSPITGRRRPCRGPTCCPGRRCANR